MTDLQGEQRRIIGIDPGSRKTGFAIIDIINKKTIFRTADVIRLGDGPMPERLGALHQSLSLILDEYLPQHAAVEDIFMHKNAMSALKLGQARGAAIGLMAARELCIASYAPKTVKQSIVGKGSAEKGQVAHMVRLILGVQQTLQEDAADALAIALCHAHHILGARTLMGQTT